MKLLNSLILLTLPLYSATSSPVSERVPEHRVKIAVIDTGLNVTPKIRPLLCKSGHWSIIDNRPLKDSLPSGHGTNVAGLIADKLDPRRECLLIIKFFKAGDDDFFKRVRLSINYAVSQRVKFINLSLGGRGSSKLEQSAIALALSKGVRISVAAGNNRKNLTQRCDFFPACYNFKTRLFRVVGSSTGNYSNYGDVITTLEDGTQVGTPKLSGTSQATAINTGKWVREVYK